MPAVLPERRIIALHRRLLVIVLVQRRHGQWTQAPAVPRRPGEGDRAGPRGYQLHYILGNQSQRDISLSLRDLLAGRVHGAPGEAVRLALESMGPSRRVSDVTATISILYFSMMERDSTISNTTIACFVMSFAAFHFLFRLPSVLVSKVLPIYFLIF